MMRTWQITTVTDAARAGIALARLAAAYGVPTVERTRLAAALSAHLRQCLTKGGTWLLTTDLAGSPTEEGLLHAVVTPSPDASAAAGEPPWEVAVPCPEAVRAGESGTVADDPAALAEALLGADEDTAVVLDKLTEQEDLVSFHREELHQTNQGVLALHAELDAAGRAQREAFAAERSARNEAESARRRLTFLADASAVLTASLNHEEIVRRLPDLLVPEYARSVDIWLFDHEDDRHGSAPHPAAAVVAARTGRPQYAADHPGGLPGVEDQPPVGAGSRAAVAVHPAADAAGAAGSPDPVAARCALGPGRRGDADRADPAGQHRDRQRPALRAQPRHRRDAAARPAHGPADDAGPESGRTGMPATHGMNIGGDWYDAFRQRDGGLITVIGDVTGHGLHAAVMMSQLRTALRAYAVDGDSPGRLLTRLHRFLHHLQPDLYATAASRASTRTNPP
ncbi:hypothetical protein SPURM210S_01954 [Streptomyces purpurascens]